MADIRRVMDHGGPDPFQGFDVAVWVQDPSRNGTAGNLDGVDNMVLLGEFTSLIVTVRNATEAYLEFNSRIPRYLDGEMQMAFVMEKGQVDMFVLRQTFGFDEMRRNKRFNRSPRLAITFNVDTNGELNSRVVMPNKQYMTEMSRSTSGRYIMHNCKIDSWHFAATAGKQVVANQWQGVFEGIEMLNTSINLDQGVLGADTSIPSGGGV